MPPPRVPGVVVLLDIGSAILSAKMALEMVAPEVRERTELSPAPLVEGLIVAMVNASVGATRERVAHDAAQALAPKQTQLGG